MDKKPLFIAEIKTKSPFGFQSQQSWEELFELANQYGDIIAIHTHPDWGGSLKLLEKARNLTNKLILAKGIPKNKSEVWSAMMAGANQVLTVGFVCEDLSNHTIFEPINFDQLYLPKYVYPNLKVMWNQRNLVNGKPKEQKFSDIRKDFQGYLIQASYIESMIDVNKDADAFIVGTKLKKFIETLSK